MLYSSRSIKFIKDPRPLRDQRAVVGEVRLGVEGEPGEHLSSHTSTLAEPNANHHEPINMNIASRETQPIQKATH